MSIPLYPWEWVIFYTWQKRVVHAQRFQPRCYIHFHLFRYFCTYAVFIKTCIEMASSKTWKTRTKFVSNLSTKCIPRTIITNRWNSPFQKYLHTLLSICSMFRVKGVVFLLSNNFSLLGLSEFQRAFITLVITRGLHLF